MVRMMMMMWKVFCEKKPIPPEPRSSSAILKESTSWTGWNWIVADCSFYPFFVCIFLVHVSSYQLLQAPHNNLPATLAASVRALPSVGALLKVTINPAPVVWLWELRSIIYDSLRQCKDFRISFPCLHIDDISQSLLRLISPFSPPPWFIPSLPFSILPSPSSIPRPSFSPPSPF